MLFMQIMSTSSTYKALHPPWCLSILVGWVSLAEYIRVLRIYPTILQVKFLAYWRWWLTTGGLSDSIFILIYMLLSKEVTYATNVFGTYINAIIWKLYCFPLPGFETQTYTIICEPICNIISTTTLCMWCVFALIMQSWLWCWFTEVLHDTRWTTGFI